MKQPGIAVKSVFKSTATGATALLTCTTQNRLLAALIAAHLRGLHRIRKAEFFLAGRAWPTDGLNHDVVFSKEQK
jgi:hypothetical protein